MFYKSLFKYCFRVKQACELLYLKVLHSKRYFEEVFLPIFKWPVENFATSGEKVGISFSFFYFQKFFNFSSYNIEFLILLLTINCINFFWSCFQTTDNNTTRKSHDLLAHYIS